MTSPVQGEHFDPDEEKLAQVTAEYWRKVWNETPVQTIERVEDAAKQLIVVTSGLQGLYGAIFAFSNIRAQVTTALGGVAGWLILLLFFTPPACWLVSLLYATRVLVLRVQPDVNFNEVSVSAWQKVKDTFGRVNEEKLNMLQHSHRWLITSFALVLIAAMVLVFLPTVPTMPTRIIIVTPIPVVTPTPPH